MCAPGGLKLKGMILHLLAWSIGQNCSCFRYEGPKVINCLTLEFV